MSLSLLFPPHLLPCGSPCANFRREGEGDVKMQIFKSLYEPLELLSFLEPIIITCNSFLPPFRRSVAGSLKKTMQVSPICSLGIIALFFRENLDLVRKAYCVKARDVHIRWVLFGIPVVCFQRCSQRTLGGNLSVFGRGYLDWISGVSQTGFWVYLEGVFRAHTASFRAATYIQSSVLVSWIGEKTLSSFENLTEEKYGCRQNRSLGREYLF